ncbi:MAG: hypothetical protein WC700_17535 [Gemmatimonadaceae bacterium]|jgi:hypothetical protein
MPPPPGRERGRGSNHAGRDRCVQQCYEDEVDGYLGALGADVAPEPPSRAGWYIAGAAALFALISLSGGSRK